VSSVNEDARPFLRDMRESFSSFRWRSVEMFELPLGPPDEVGVICFARKLINWECRIVRSS
jgi:hypothetical protein